MRADNKEGGKRLDARKQEFRVVKEQEALGQCNRLTWQGAVPDAIGLMAEASQWARLSAMNHVYKKREILTIGKTVEILFGLHHCKTEYFRAV